MILSKFHISDLYFDGFCSGLVTCLFFHRTFHSGFDRLYFYGVHRPIHVSVGPEHSGSVVLMRRRQNSDKRVPHRISIKKFLALNVQHELIVSCTSETGQMA